jgi:hypothetical protein
MRNGFDMLRPSGFGERGMFPFHSTAGYVNSSQSDSVSRPESSYFVYRRDEKPHAFQRDAEDRVGPGDGPSVSP